MWKKFAAAGFLCLVYTAAIAQLQKFYTVKSDGDFESIKFSLNATSGGCFIKASETDNLIEIYGNPDFEHINPSLETYTNSENQKIVTLNLEDYQNAGLMRTLSTSVFDSRKKDHNFWKIFFNKSEIYDLDLHYGVGDAYLNLSEIPIGNLKVIIGSADVVINYDDTAPVSIPMDSFYVKVDMGKLSTINIEKSNASKVIADIGFGNATLDFSAPSTHKSHILANVGAGKLTIFLPVNDTPTIINLNDSPMCGRRLLDGYKEIRKNVFVNESYSADAANLRTFDIDVALGSIVFRHK
uniref:hypothetical protein n=1 Tax=Fulvivirga sp. TaxID=1931237 RepID=UPI00404AA59D